MDIKNTEDEQRIEAFHDLAETALAKGCVQGIQPGSYHLINLALEPFESSLNFYQYLSQLQYIWQILFHRTSNDDTLIEQILNLGAADDWICFLAKIYKSSKTSNCKDSLTFCRTDYLIERQQPKIVEYNLMTVGMSHSNHLMTESHRQVFPLQKENYFENNATRYLIEAIRHHYSSRRLQGLFLFIISSKQSITIFQQKFIEQQLRLSNIRCKRVRLRDLLEHSKKDPSNNLHFRGQLVSFAYYYTGFNLKHYDQAGSKDEGLKAAVLLADSNVTCVPSIRMMIINTKSGQAVISKPHVLRKYLTEDDAQKLEKTFVQNLVLSELTEPQFQQLLHTVTANPQLWVLKPNMQGGGNNLFGQNIVTALQALSPLDRGKYSLMKKIQHNPQYDNYIIVREATLKKVRCTYQIGRYGLVSTIGGHIVQNIAGGSSIRTKQVGEDCTSTHYGTDGYVAWRATDDAI